MDDILRNYYKRHLDTFDDLIDPRKRLDTYFKEVFKEKSNYPQEAFEDVMKIARVNIQAIKQLEEERKVFQEKYDKLYGGS